jgi:hypothetical protein
VLVRAALDQELSVTAHPDLDPVRSRALWDLFDRIAHETATGWAPHEVDEAMDPGHPRHAELAAKTAEKAAQFNDAFGAAAVSEGSVPAQVRARLEERLAAHPLFAGREAQSIGAVVAAHLGVVRRVITTGKNRGTQLSGLQSSVNESSARVSLLEKAYEENEYRMGAGCGRSQREAQAASQERARYSSLSAQLQALLGRPFSSICLLCGRTDSRDSGCCHVGKSPWTSTSFL